MFKGTICVVSATVLWGFSGACSQILYGNPAIAPEFVTAVRALITAVTLGAFALVAHRKAFLGLLRDRNSRVPLVLYAFGLFAGQECYAFCVQATNAGTATVLQSVYMVIVMAVTCLQVRRLPHGTEVAGLVCALVGTWVIATGGDGASLTLPLNGLAWGFAAACAVALYVVAPERLYGRWGSMPVIAAGMVLSSFCSLLLWTATSMSAGFAVPVLNVSEVLFLVGGVSLVGTAVAYFIYLYGISIVGPVRGSILGAFEPVSSMVVAFLWLAVPLSGADWIGTAFMAAMIVLVSLSE